nr:hypothetical protein [Plastoroseomonas hellenica]
MVLADRQIDRQAAIEAELGSLDTAALQARFAVLEEQVTAALSEGGAADVELRRRLDCRYAGQPDSILFDWPGSDATAIRQAFEEEHRRLWNFDKPDQVVIVNNLRIEGRAPSGWRGRLRFADAVDAPAPWRRRAVRLGNTAQDLPVWRRRDLPPGFAVQGPAVIEEQSSSIVLGADDTARVDDAFMLVIDLGPEGGRA